MQNVGIKSERKLAEVTGTGIRIENFVQLLRLVACCIDNLAIAKLQSDAIEAGAQLNAKARMTDDCRAGIAKFLKKTN